MYSYIHPPSPVYIHMYSYIDSGGANLLDPLRVLNQSWPRFVLPLYSSLALVSNETVMVHVARRKY